MDQTMRSCHSAVSALLLLAAIGGTLPAQSSPLRAATPEQCSKAVAEWRKAQTAEVYTQYLEATPETRDAAQARYTAALTKAEQGMARLAGECAAGFELATIDPAQLPDLVRLYRTAGDSSATTRAITRLLSLPDLQPRLRGQALTLGIEVEIAANGNHFGILDGAERYVREIDRLPDSLADLKLAAHTTMLGRYGYLDVALGLEQHARAVIALGKQLNRKASVIRGYSELARSYADRLHPDSALQLLDQAELEISDTSTTRAFEEFRHRYALIGTTASAITGQWWVNLQTASPPQLPVPGQVTLIEFTAHWCGPCKNSYPGLRALAQRFQGTEFRGVMVTQLYGYIGDRKGLTPEQEIEADREYFGREHALPFPVAINPTAKVVLPGDSYAMPLPDSRYRVGGIPQIIIVDKQGIIRQIVTGWDQGNTARIGKLIESLLEQG